MSALAAMPRGMLLALTACVLIAHLWVLSSAPFRMRIPASTPVPTFTVRRIALPVIAPDPAAAPPPAARPRPATSPPPRRRALPALKVAATPARPEARGEEPTVPAAAAAPPDIQVARLRVPEPVELHYEVTARVRGQQVQGTSELRWHHDGQRYEAAFEVAVAALTSRRQHSAGELVEGGLAPHRYAETGRGEQATHFEREGQRFIFSNNRPTAPLVTGAQDRLSVLLQLSAMLNGAPQRYPRGTTIAIQTATTREAGTWPFTVEGEESLRLPGGELPTVKLVRPPRGEYEPRIEIWFAPGAAYVPVRLRLTQPNGDWVDHQWSATDRR